MGARATRLSSKLYVFVIILAPRTHIFVQDTMGSTASCGVRLMLATMFFLTVARSRRVVAQETDPVTTARIHLGPLGLNPSMGLANVGVDNNVFNETTNPKRDFTFTA